MADATIALHCKDAPVNLEPLQLDGIAVPGVRRLVTHPVIVFMMEASLSHIIWAIWGLESWGNWSAFPQVIFDGPQWQVSGASD